MNDFDARLKRTLNAVAMEPVDKIPYSYSGPAYCAREAGMSIAEFVSDAAKAVDAAIMLFERHPGIDSLHSPMFDPYALPTLWLSRVVIPGVDLPDDELWQMDEQEVLTREDYETVIRDGYGPWFQDVLANRLGDPLAKMQSHIEYTPIGMQRLYEAGIPIMNGATTGTPFEGFCGGRGLQNFFIDVVEEPELVKEAFDKAQEFLMGNFIGMLDMAKPIAAWVGGWRVAPELMSHDMWMEYAWAYLKPLILATIDRGVVPVLHFDSNWDSELETLKELPAKKCILMLDNATDIRKAREVLDDRMCLLGDVPASMLAFGTESQVYDYVVKLIDDVGPKTGLIVSSGCDTPLNAKPENVAAMVQATVDYQV